MASITTHTCDRCKKSVNNADLFSVGIICEHVSYIERSRHFPPSHKQSAEWCRECVDETKINHASLLRPPEPDQVVTLEDMIREIVRSEI